ncbi:hypothetical protein MFFC18_24100 [Mariniblastus fucicola]|uniref:Copper resistance protein D n=2 Tax=Mariniblastus fucicola TaxID=980251 RepID=A0A5B9PAL5_9BACT|nr:hypothetical protein MFFC18_24100 [Mariniblastus fucicola]
MRHRGMRRSNRLTWIASHERLDSKQPKPFFELHAMELTEIFAQLSRWAHIIAAIVLTGGTLFMRFALVPAMLETSASEEVQQAVRKRWMKWVAGAALFLLVSGFYNAYLKAIGFELSPIYNGFLGAKILLGFFAFWLSATLVGRSERAKRFREREIFWLNILTSVVLVIVLMAGFMKMDSTDYVKKVKSEPVTVVEE